MAFVLYLGYGWLFITMNSLVPKEVDEVSEVLVHFSVEQLPEGPFLVRSDDVPGLIAQGRTIAEAIEIAQDVARKIIESYREHGDPLPPKLQHFFSGRGDVISPVAVD